MHCIQRCSTTHFKSIIIIISVCMIIMGMQSAEALMRKVELSELVTDSDIIVRGHIADKTPFWFNDHKWIYTRVTMVPDEYIYIKAGAAQPESVINFIIPGGIIDGLGMGQSDTPVFEEGDHVVLFLRPDYIDPTQLSVSGSFQGRWSVRQDSSDNTVIISPSGDLAYEGGIVQQSSEEIPFDQFKKLIQRIVVKQNLSDIR